MDKSNNWPPSGSGLKSLCNDFTYNKNTAAYRRGLPPPRSWRFSKDGVSRPSISHHDRDTVLIPRCLPEIEIAITGRSEEKTEKRKAKKRRRCSNNKEAASPPLPSVTKPHDPPMPEDVWVETKTEIGAPYYYHSVTLKRAWIRPVGPNVRVVPYDDGNKGAHESPSQKGVPDSKCSTKPQNKIGLSDNNLQSHESKRHTSCPIPVNPTVFKTPGQSSGGDTNSSRSVPCSSSQNVPNSSSSLMGGSVPFNQSTLNSNIAHSIPMNTGMEQSKMIAQMAGVQQSMPYYCSVPYQHQPMSAHPQQGIVPAAGYSQKLGVVPSTWGVTLGIGITPFSSLPGLGLSIVDPFNPILQYINPEVVTAACEWTEFKTGQGRPYYYNEKTKITTWDKPDIVKKFEDTRSLLQQCVAAAQTFQNHNDKSSNNIAMNSPNVKVKKGETNGECRPISSNVVPGTNWLVVWTADLRAFYHNSSTKQSVWARPLELIGRSDVDDLLKCPPQQKKQINEVKRVEATSTTSPAYDEKEKKSDSFTEQTGKKAIDNVNHDQPKSSRELTQTSDNPGVGVLSSQNDNSAIAIQQNVTPDPIEDEKSSLAKEDKLKEENTRNAEIMAAKKRAEIPIDLRLKQFTQMLHDKKVSALSTWEKELHLIIYDERYLLLTSKDRKTAFENYVKDQAGKEKMEQETKIKNAKNQFMKYLKEVVNDDRMTFAEFSIKHENHESYVVVEKSRDRELYFTQYTSDLRTQRVMKEKAKRYLLAKLKREVTDYHVEWSDLKSRFGRDSYCENLKEEEMKDLFLSFQKDLKTNILKRREKEKKKEKRDKTRKGHKPFLAPDN